MQLTCHTLAVRKCMVGPTPLLASTAQQMRSKYINVASSGAVVNTQIPCLWYSRVRHAGQRPYVLLDCIAGCLRSLEGR